MTDESSALVDLRVQLDRGVNFAMQQNDVPVIKGFQRLGRVVDKRIRQGLAHLVERGVARLEAGVIVLSR